MKGLSLFSSAGIDQFFLKKNNFEIVLANEKDKQRAKLYKILYPDSEMVVGDIDDKVVFSKILKRAQQLKVDFLIATPPCQGVSLAGKNKSFDEMLEDERNYLIFKAIEVAKTLKPKFFLIENVTRFEKLFLPYKGSFSKVFDILKSEFKDCIVDMKVLDCSHYSVPQKRERIVYRVYKNEIKWLWPKKSEIISVRDAIGHLPSLESGQKSAIKWHYARKHSERHISSMRHTPEGCSAFDNNIHFPKKKNGERVKGWKATYSRMRWDYPAPTITIRNDAISSQTNVHPGRKNRDGTYSDARVLTILEILIVCSLPEDWNIPDWATDQMIRTVTGECIPPKMLMRIFQEVALC